MWIAVCDDDPKYCASVEKVLRDFLSADDEIVIYNSGIEMLESVMYSSQPLDLVLMDIEMPGLSGLETARELRVMQPSAVIILITGYIRYMQKGYEIRAFNYLLKPMNTARLRNEIEKVRSIVNSTTRDVFHVATKESSYFVPLQDIVYLESFGRTLHVNTQSNRYSHYKRISQAEYELKDKGFFRIHKSYIVNLIYVKQVDKSEKAAILSNGVKLPVSPTKLNGLTGFMSKLLTIRKNRI